MVKIIFFPPITKRREDAEHHIAIAGPMEINAFIAMLRGDSSLVGHFNSIREYARGENFLREVIVIVNDTLADNGCQVKDGDVVKLVLPLAGG